MFKIKPNKPANHKTEEIVNIMKAVSEIRDSYTAEHQQRVALFSCAIAEEMSLPESQITGLYIAAQLHDIGKIGIPIKILNKPGKLTDREYNIIKTHTELGYTMLENINFGYPVAEIVYQHHERIDGSGYPQGLKNESIFQGAKILTVADVFDAMRTDRPYRPALGVIKILFELSEYAGTLYDPSVVDACHKVINKKKKH